MTNDEKIRQQLSEKLADFECNLPKDDWEMIAPYLPQATHSRKPVWLASAAAGIAVLLTGGLVWLYQSADTSPDTQHTTAQAVISPQTVEHNRTVKPAIRQQTTTPQPLSATSGVSGTAKTTPQPLPVEDSTESAAAEVQADVSIQEKKQFHSETQIVIDEEEANRLMNQQRQLDKQQEAHSATTLKHVPQKRDWWNIGIQANVSPSIANGFNVKQSMFLPSIQNNGKPLVIRSLASRVAQHDLPISVGLSLGIPIASGWDVKTGLTYTFSHSKFYSVIRSTGVTVTACHQYLHYLGIPIMASHRFFDHERVALYVSLGGMAEKGIANVQLKESGNNEVTGTDPSRVINAIDGVQFSLASNMGIEVQLYRDLDIYFEPGLVWYIPENIYPQPENMRTENPLYISLTAGLRFNIHRQAAKKGAF
ncbi:MAG: PorT family protein [Prevotellaceae bacterium]|jgi:hypothetical protein|nr:PorT family protein [Prevotellaceae bacterium]